MDRDGRTGALGCRIFWYKRTALVAMHSFIASGYSSYLQKRRKTCNVHTGRGGNSRAKKSHPPHATGSVVCGNKLAVNIARACVRACGRRRQRRKRAGNPGRVTRRHQLPRGDSWLSLGGCTVGGRAGGRLTGKRAIQFPQGQAPAAQEQGQPPLDRFSAYSAGRDTSTHARTHVRTPHMHEHRGI